MCAIERRGGGEREGEREHFTLPLANLRKAPVWRSCMKRVVPTEDFLIGPWKPRSGGKRRRDKAKQETRILSEGLPDFSYMCSCHGEILDDRFLLTGASLCLGFPKDQSLFSEQSV